MAEGSNGDAQQQEPQQQGQQLGAQSQQQEPQQQGQQRSDDDAAGHGDDVKDTHGQPGINKERHDKEVAALQARIAELEGKLDDAAKTEKARDELKKEIQQARDEISAEKLTWQLEKEGCVNVKAAKAVLDDHDGDVSKLKAACPYLFGEDKPKGSTGGKPAGATSDEEKELARMREVAGLNDKK